MTSTTIISKREGRSATQPRFPSYRLERKDVDKLKLATGSLLKSVTDSNAGGDSERGELPMYYEKSISED